MTFGKYMQSVMSLLVTLHSWDDPYGSISPDNDGSDKVIDAIFDAFMHMRSPKQASLEAHNAWISTGH